MFRKAPVEYIEESLGGSTWQNVLSETISESSQRPEFQTDRLQ